MEDERPARDLAGKTLHHYKVLEKLGAGGMGEVWIAEDLHLERRIALKLLPASGEVDSGRLLRFEREAKAVAALDHPNIVTLHSIEEADSIRFMTMELLSGKRLDQTIPEGGMDLETFLGLAIPIADAVAAAHQRGITHRDLKPANVVLTADGRPKVLDFGLAELRDAGDAEEDTPQTQTLEKTLTRTATQVAEVAGTVPYMSPEQLTGGRTDQRSDVFSLGIVFHEMLTGGRPFVADHLVALMASILRDSAPKLTKLRPDLPSELADLLQRSLEKRPADRFADAGTLRDALVQLRDAWLSGSQTAIQVPYRTSSLAKTLTKATVVVLLVVVTTFALAWQQGWLPASSVDQRVERGIDLSQDPVSQVSALQASAPQRIAVLPFENLGQSDDSYFSAGIAEEIRSRLAAVRGLGVISRNAASRYAREGLSRAEIADALEVDFVLDGTVRWDRTGDVDRVRVTPQLVRVADDTQLWSGTYDRLLEDIFSVQTEIAEEVVGNLDLALFPAEQRALAAERPTSSLPAYQAFLRARDHLSESIYERAGYEAAIRELEAALSLDPDFGVAWAELSSTHSMLYHLGHDRTPARIEKARRALQKAEELAPEASDVRFARGYFRYRIEKDFDAALGDFRAVTDQLPGDSDGYEAMGYVLRRQGRLEEAASYLERAVNLSPGSGRLLIEVATTRLFLRQYEASRRLYEQAILQSPNDPNVYRALTLTHWLSSGDLPSARQTLESMPENDEPVTAWYWFHQHLFEGNYEAALESAEPESGPTLVRWTFFAYPTHLLQGQALELLGRNDEARVAFTAAEAQLRRKLEENLDDSRLHSALALALAGLGEDQAAVESAQRGVELLPVSLDAGTGPYRLFELALVQTRIGRTDEALRTLRELLSIPSRVSKRLIEIDPRFADLVAHPQFDELP